MERDPHMSYDEFDDTQDNETQGPKALRDALEKANKALADREKKLDEALARIGDFERKAKSDTLSNLLKAKNVDPKYARWADKDGVEPTEDAVAAWLKENEDLIPVSRGNNEATDEVDDPDADAVHEDQGDPFADLPEEMKTALAALGNSQALEAASVPTPPVDERSEAARLRAIAAVGQSASNESELLAALAKLGAPVKTGY